MKRYLTLLTISFLSSSTLAKAGFDIFDPPTSPAGRAGSLRAKADRLQKNIGNTQNEGLVKTLTTQRGIINRLLNAPLNEKDSSDYFEAKEQKYNIKRTFVEEVRNGMHEQQFNKIDRTLRAEIYARESQEFKDLDAAIQLFSQIRSDRYSFDIGPIKAAGRYLKMEKLIAPHIQKADKIIENHMAEAEKIKASGVKRDLEILIRRLNYASDEYETVGQALNLLEQINRENEYSEYLTESLLGYKALEDKLKPLLSPFRQSRQDAPAFMASVFSGASEYAKLEEGLSSLYSYQYGAPPEVQEFLGIMNEIRGLPFLLMRLKELQPKAQELLANPPSLGDYNNASPFNQTSAVDQAWMDDLNFDRGQMDVDSDFDSESDSESSDSSALHHVATTFRTAGANERAEIKHSAVYASFSYQNKPDAAYSLIINHRTKAKGSVVRVHNPNAKAYINLGRLSPSIGFSDEVFNLSSLFKSVPGASSGASVMRTELNFMDGISDIHSFTIKSGEETLIEVTLGDEESEKQTGVHVYAPELPGKPQEWSEKKSDE
jgi:hypothetical protein